MTKRFYQIIIISFISFILISGCNDESETPEQGEVANQQSENPSFSTNPMGDIEVDDEELLRFVDLDMTLSSIQAEARQELLDLLKEEELSVDTYNSIRHAKSMGFSLDDYDFSNEDLEKYDVVSELIIQHEQEVDEKFEKAISQAGFSRERFLELNVAMQYNMELMERSRELIMLEGE